MTVEERARRAAGKRAFVVALRVEYYQDGKADTTRAQLYDATVKAIKAAVLPFGAVAAIKIGSEENIIERKFL